LLALLETHRGQNISGEFIAAQLNISRAAVWKAVKELEKDGYFITAATKRGYCLSQKNDILSAEGIAAFLHEKHTIIVELSLESTNITAKQMAVLGAAHGTVVIADHQTAGHGRHGRSFFSPKGCGIYMSFVLRPSQIFIPHENLSLITAYAAVAVCDAIEEICGKSPKIKWVNDIFLDGKKICGISTEAVTDFQSGEISWIVAGIGVNYTMPSSVPDEFAEIIGAIHSEKLPENAAPRNHLAAAIIRNMDSFMPNFLDIYRKKLLYLGEKVIVTGGHEPFTATALYVDGSGRLIVRDESGETIVLTSGEVSVKGA
jgi:BirA family biotin operon repressor/biotin-[acetyl-CoA-carboxylase] ligase